MKIRSLVIAFVCFLLIVVGMSLTHVVTEEQIYSRQRQAAQPLGWFDFFLVIYLLSLTAAVLLGMLIPVLLLFRWYGKRNSGRHPLQ